MISLLEGVPILEKLTEDAQTAFERDPSANHPLEVLLYPGVHALWIYRFANAVKTHGHPVLARACSQLGRIMTGVDIHPAANIGRRVFIDHAIGVVIGETSKIGDDVLMYHGVTLGANEVTDGKRHPTVEDGATIGANATLLGPVTLGSGATVGAGSVVVDDIPADATVAGEPADSVDRRQDIL